MIAHALAGKAVLPEDLVDLKALKEAYYELAPDPRNRAERVSFGTSGHRGVSTKGSFNDLHVAAITQAVCDLRREFGATGPCFVGQDTHALSQDALVTVLEVLAGNGVLAAVDAGMNFVPTPSVSRAIIRYNERAEDRADGLIITPSHNPPDNGGIKYNPVNGGPADTAITKRIEERANQYLETYCQEVKRISIDNISPEAQMPYDFKGLYVEELEQIINMGAIKEAKLHVLVNALGGSGGAYWEAIRDRYGLDLTIINAEYDPTFSFMTYDHDGLVRMDCSSVYAMADVIGQIGDFDLAVGNDPDYDRYGVVTQEGLLNANHFLVTAAKYLFNTRGWRDKGVGKTAVVTLLVDKWAADREIPVYEVPVGFKYFSSLLFNGLIGIGGEESAGASFLKKDGTVWTTDKDGIIMALLAMEMYAVTGQSPASLYADIVNEYGRSHFGRIEAACTKEQKDLLKRLSEQDVKARNLTDEKIESIRTTSLYQDMPIDGLKVSTRTGWFVARPSGTEDLYKVYGESLRTEAVLKDLLQEGCRIVSEAIEK